MHNYLQHANDKHLKLQNDKRLQYMYKTRMNLAQFKLSTQTLAFGLNTRPSSGEKAKIAKNSLNKYSTETAQNIINNGRLGGYIRRLLQQQLKCTRVAIEYWLTLINE